MDQFLFLLVIHVNVLLPAFERFVAASDVCLAVHWYLSMANVSLELVYIIQYYTYSQQWQIFVWFSCSNLESTDLVCVYPMLCTRINFIYYEYIDKSLPMAGCC